MTVTAKSGAKIEIPDGVVIANKVSSADSHLPFNWHPEGNGLYIFSVDFQDINGPEDI